MSESRKHGTGWIFGLLKGWLIAAILCATLAAAIGLLLQPVMPLAWHTIAISVAFVLLPWILLPPIVIQLAKAIPIAPGTWKTALPAHLALGLAICLGTAMAAAPFVSVEQKNDPSITAIQVEVPGTERQPSAPKISATGVRIEGAATATIYGLFVYWTSLTGAHLWMFYRESQRQQRKALELVASLSKARLHALRMQIQPHFLFNTLNALGGLNRTNPDAADEMLVSICDFLRATLGDLEEQEVPLARELEIMRSYLEIEKIRFDDRLSFVIDAAPETLACKVPVLLLQPLVENAVQHGIEPLQERGEVRVAAEKAEGKLRIIIRDNGKGLGPAPLREGVGLENSRGRIREMYGDAARLDIASAGIKGTVVTIELPWRS